MLNIKPSEDIVPMSEFRNNLSECATRVRNSGRPILLTQNGRASYVFMDLTVNGRPITTLMTHSRSWTVPARVSLDVYLKKGRNSICLSNGTDWMPDIDKMTIE